MSAFDWMQRLAEYGAPVDDDDVFAAELLFERPVGEELVHAVVRDVLRGDADPVLSPGSGDGEDDDWLLELPHLRSRGFEGLGFALARELAREISGLLSDNRCLEGNFIPVDSVYGAAAVAGAGFVSGVCDTPRSYPTDDAWPHRETRICRVWNPLRGQGVRIASIDTGYSGHPDLAGIVDLGRQINVVERKAPNDAADRFNDGLLLFPGHGTTTKSVIASRGDVDTMHWRHVPDGTVTGAAPEAMIVPVRATRSVIAVRQTRLPPAMRAAVGADAHVISMCLGGPAPVRAVQTALLGAIEAGLVVVSAAGNCYPAVVYPGKFSLNGLALCLGAVGYGDRGAGRGLKPWDRSPAGAGVSVVAPGEDVKAARAENASTFTYSSAQGTTLATSLTAGIAALWLAHHGHAAIRAAAAAAGVHVHTLFMEAAISTAYDVPHWTAQDRRKTGAGLIDAEAILGLPLAPLAAAAAKRPRPRVLSTVALLRTWIGGARLKTLGLSPQQERECAAELIWLKAVTGAAVRAGGMAGLTGAIAFPRPSDEVGEFIIRDPGLLTEDDLDTLNPQGGT